MQAIYSNNEAEVTRALQAGTDWVNMEILVTYYGMQFPCKECPLRRAAERGYVSIVEKLLDGGADINLAIGRRYQWACGIDHPDVVKLCIKRGANMESIREALIEAEKRFDGTFYSTRPPGASELAEVIALLENPEKVKRGEQVKAKSLEEMPSWSKAMSLGLLPVLTSPGLASAPYIARAVSFCNDKGVRRAAHISDYGLIDDFIKRVGMDKLPVVTVGELRKALASEVEEPAVPGMAVPAPPCSVGESVLPDMGRLNITINNVAGDGRASSSCAPANSLAEKVGKIKMALQLDASLSMPAAIQAANELMAMQPRNGLPAQADALLDALGV